MGSISMEKSQLKLKAIKSHRWFKLESQKNKTKFSTNLGLG